MLGSALQFERTAAGTSGPRGCEPLAWSPPSRIARSAGHWYAPRTAQFLLTTTPQRVVKANVNRAILAIMFDTPPGSGPLGEAVLCATQKDALLTPALGPFGSVWPNGGGVKTSHVISYTQWGALATNEWWAVVSVSTTGCVLNVLEQEYYG